MKKTLNNHKDEKFPDPKELEKEIGDFLTKRFGGNIKMSTPIILPQESVESSEPAASSKSVKISFDLKPEELVAYLDQYIIKQANAKAILATKICTHFNRIRQRQSQPDRMSDMVGSIKNNILMLGPTGVGKTYMIRLIAHKLGVPFVKGDATKFSETGYVGGDVEDLVRDLVREADGDIERAQYGIIYIDEIDKIASAQNLIGADVSRTGVQRALLKPMEETEVDLKVPHDPISMLQEIERYRKTGKREKSAVNTKNILFIMSGAFAGLEKIIKKRVADQAIGFGAPIGRHQWDHQLLNHTKAEDLIAFGFESEFVGRLPVRAVFESLYEQDLLEILLNPSNPIILSKKLDFAAYGIEIKFDEEALRFLAKQAFDENTGARGLVSAVERALLEFEKRLPSTRTRHFAFTCDMMENRRIWLDKFENPGEHPELEVLFEKTKAAEAAAVVRYLTENKTRLGEKFNLTMTPVRISLMAAHYTSETMDIENLFKKFNYFYDQIKSIEMRFLKNNGLNIVLEEDALDHILAEWVDKIDVDALFLRLSSMFEYGLKLVREKTGRSRFFITRQALLQPEEYISQLLVQHQSREEASAPASGAVTAPERK